MPNLSTWVFSVEILYLLGTQASSIQDANENVISVQTVFKVIVSETEIISFLLCIFLTVQKCFCILFLVFVFYFSNLTEGISQLTHLASFLASALHICDKSVLFCRSRGKSPGAFDQALSKPDKETQRLHGRSRPSVHTGAPHLPTPTLLNTGVENPSLFFFETQY